MDIRVNKLSVKEYKRLFNSVGWGNPDEKQIKKALKNSYATFSLMDGKKTIGMARLLSDGAMEYFLKDVAIDPEYQRRGFGLQLMRFINDFVERDIPSGWWAFFELFAAKGKEPFYEKSGLEIRPNDTRGAGLFRFIAKK